MMSYKTWISWNFWSLLTFNCVTSCLIQHLYLQVSASLHTASTASTDSLGLASLGSLPIFPAYHIGDEDSIDSI